MNSTTACRDFATGRPSRRHLLRIGAAGLLGLAGLNVLPAADRKARSQSVIFLHQWGGPPQQETFDLKPDAADGVRGIFKPISTSLPGVPTTELLPRMAPLMKKVALLRSLRHEMKNHNSAGYYSLTGYPPATDDQRLRDSRDLFPAYGSVVDRLAPAKKGLPSFVAYPHVISDGSITPGQHASFLGKAHDPLLTTQDPNADDFRLPELTLPASLTPDRLENRREMLKFIDDEAKLREHSGRARDLDEAYGRALDMLTAPALKKAFDLSAEPAAVRERYGRTTYGQGCLLARRLVEAGVKFVNVYFAAVIGGDNGGWDVHGFNNKPMAPILKNYLLPLTNQTLPTLLEDLEVRGLLETTTVVWVGEFGRTPKINNLAGRDHWPQCYTALLAGAGVKKGYVHGASDRTGSAPAEDPCRPEDLSATLFHLLGIDPKTEIRDSLDRPLPVSKGDVIQGLLA